MSELENVRIQDAIELYLETRESELTFSTLRAHRYRLQHLPRFADEHGIDYDRSCEEELAAQQRRHLDKV